ncbi:MAG: divalent-cation tolerance protein CutA [Alphaproteobacteria bacterium]|nr:divalent-cation tolerance protein CutA [Alphaproteobacteria bacterium]
MNATDERARLLYVTCADAEEAMRIGRVLVEERIAACTNMLDGMRALYWWDGKVREGREAVLLVKTRADRVEAAIGRIKALHSYSVPCIAELAVGLGNPDYLAWISVEAAPGRG